MISCMELRGNYVGDLKGIALQGLGRFVPNPFRVSSPDPFIATQHDHRRAIEIAIVAPGHQEWARA